MIQFLFQGGEQLILRKLFYDLAMLDQKTDAVSPGNSDVCFLCLSRSVYHTSHNSHLNIQWEAGYHGLYFICQTDQIDLRTSTGRTGYHLDTTFAKSQSTKDQFCGLDLFNWITSQGDTDRITDPLA